MVSLRVLGGSPRRLHDSIPGAVDFRYSARHRRGLAGLVSTTARVGLSSPLSESGDSRFRSVVFLALRERMKTMRIAQHDALPPAFDESLAFPRAENAADGV